MKVRLAIVGSRSVKNKNRVYLEITEAIKIIKAKGHELEAIVSGDAHDGPDKFAKDYAYEFHILYKGHPAQWDDMSEPCKKKMNARGQWYNAVAGLKRNQKIIDDSTHVLAIWDGRSTGTLDTITKARAARKHLKIVYYK